MKEARDNHSHEQADKRWDVLGVGCATVDDLLYVPAYPPPDAKVAVLRHERQCGGLIATALVAAARQGARCAYGGALGDDEHSAFVLSALRAEGIDVSPAPRHPQAGAIHATVIVDQASHTRNIFYRRPPVVGALPDAPTAEPVGSARVLLVDHYGGPATVRVLDLAHSAGVAVVADLEREDVPAFADILCRCEHLIVSEKFAATVSGRARPEEAAVALLGPGQRVVIVTCGVAGCWAVSRGESAAQRFPAFAVETVDTTGCGDTFHGVYAAELARGAGLAERVRRASAAAAIKAGRHGAQGGIPNRAAVDEFLRARGEANA